MAGSTRPSSARGLQFASGSDRMLTQRFFSREPHVAALRSTRQPRFNSIVSQLVSVTAGSVSAHMWMKHCSGYNSPQSAVFKGGGTLLQLSWSFQDSSQERWSRAEAGWVTSAPKLRDLCVSQGSMRSHTENYQFLSMLPVYTNPPTQFGPQKIIEWLKIWLN